MTAKRKTLIICLSCVAVLTASWFSGICGYLSYSFILPRLLPFDCGHGLQITALSQGYINPDQTNGAILTISSDHLASILAAFSRKARLLPPGLIHDGMLITGTWSPGNNSPAGKDVLPFCIAISGKTSEHPPSLKCRYSVNAVNRLISESMTKKTAGKKDRGWIFGKYDLDQYIRFSTFHLYSQTNIVASAQTRRFPFIATGEVRYEFEDGLLRARTTPRVKMRGAIELQVFRYDDKFSLWYDIIIDDLDADVSNLPPFLDRKVAGDLKQKLSKNLNSNRKKDKFAKKNFHNTIPIMDIIVELILIEQ